MYKDGNQINTYEENIQTNRWFVGPEYYFDIQRFNEENVEQNESTFLNIGAGLTFNGMTYTEYITRHTALFDMIETNNYVDGSNIIMNGVTYNIEDGLEAFYLPYIPGEYTGIFDDVYNN